MSGRIGTAAGKGDRDRASIERTERRRSRVPVRGASAALSKAPTAIAGFDAVTRGGLPRGRTTVIFGGPGSGKTILALQTLVNGAREWDESGIFVAFEEPPAQIMTNAAAFGWDLPSLQRKKLFFLDAQLGPQVLRAGKFDLSAMLAALSVKVDQLRAKRIVFDGVDVLLAILDDPAAERTELYRIHEWLRAHDLTGILTAKLEDGQRFAQSPYGFAAYVSDCAIQLNRRHLGTVSERDLTILKYRGSAFSENRVPFAIGPRGIEVAEDSPGSADLAAAPTERLSTGVHRLDTMLNGGYLRGGSTLITGLPGAAKSTLCAAFVEAACRRGERAVYVSFDEPPAERLRNLISVGIGLRRFVKAGSLHIVSAPPLAASAEIQLMRVREAIRTQRATCVVVDPISALADSSDPAMARAVLSRFIYWIKLQGVTLVNACLISGADPATEATELGVSTLCDTWIHLSYAQTGGERNRAITVIKSRGTRHSNQLRELILSDEGIDLADVYQSGGEVLMGTLRWEQENLRRDQEQRQREEALARRRELERTQADLRTRIEEIRRELATKEAEIEAARTAEDARLAKRKRTQQGLLRQRSADAERRTASRIARETNGVTEPSLTTRRARREVS